jgi:hypothetical protein
MCSPLLILNAMTKPKLEHHIIVRVDKALHERLQTVKNYSKLIRQLLKRYFDERSS